MFFHIYADRTSAQFLKAILREGYEKDALVFDKSLTTDELCGESDRLLHGFTAFVKNVLEQNAKKVFVFDLFDRADISKGEELSKIFAPLFAAGVEIHAVAECGENEVSHAVLKAAQASGYRTKVTKALPR
jgi:hypothetical protein